MTKIWISNKTNNARNAEIYKDAYRGKKCSFFRRAGKQERILARNHFRLLNAALKLWEIERRLGIQKKKNRNAQCSHS